MWLKARSMWTREAKPRLAASLALGRAGAAQALGDHLHHTERKVRSSSDEVEETLLVDYRDAAVGRRDRRGAARPLVDERHLAEDVRRVHALDRFSAYLDVDGTLDHSKHAIRARISLLENRLAFLVITNLRFATEKFECCHESVSLIPNLSGR